MAWYGAGAAPCSLPSANARAAPAAWSQFAAVQPPGGRTRGTLAAPVSTRAAQRMDSVRKSAGSNITSAIPSERTSGPRSMRFWLSGFSMMTFSALAGPIRCGSR